MRYTLLLPAVCVLLSACSTERVEERQEGITGRYGDRLERRAIRQRERDTRDDMWWNRAMGRPLDDPGMKMY